MPDLKILKAVNLARISHEARHNIGQAESRPALVTITALERCNYRCVMCTHQEHSSPREIGPLALERLEGVLPLASDVCITGGEPYLYPHLDEFFRICRQGGCAPVVQTNGSLLKAEQRRQLLRNGVAVLKVSVDGAKPETYERIRKGGRFGNVFENLLRLSELKASRGSALPCVEFNFVAMRSNIEELEQLVLVAARLGVRTINVFLLLAENEDMARESLYFYPDLADECFLRAALLGRRHGVAVQHPPLFRLAASLDPDAQARPRCDAPWRTLTVNVDGSAAICCGGAGLAGNLNTDSFEDVWNHPRRRKVRETVNTDHELPCCRNCRQGKPMPASVSAHIPDKALAERTLVHFGRMAEAAAL